MNSRDLCLMPKLDKLLSIGIDSLKVEGRNKSEYYAGITARAYSNAMKSYYKNPESWNYEPYMSELNTLQNRGYTYGFFDGHLTHHAMNYETTRSDGNYRFTGQVVDTTADGLVVDVKNSFEVNDVLEMLPPSKFEVYHHTVKNIINMKNNEKLEKATVATKRILLPFTDFDMSKEEVLKLFPIYTIMRKKYN